MNTTISLGVIWGGYLLVWWGISVFKSPNGPNLLDLANPSKVQLALAKFAAQASQSASPSGTLPLGPDLTPVPPGSLLNPPTQG